MLRKVFAIAANFFLRRTSRNTVQGIRWRQLILKKTISLTLSKFLCKTQMLAHDFKLEKYVNV